MNLENLILIAYYDKQFNGRSLARKLYYSKKANTYIWIREQPTTLYMIDIISKAQAAYLIFDYYETNYAMPEGASAHFTKNYFNEWNTKYGETARETLFTDIEGELFIKRI